MYLVSRPFILDTHIFCSSFSFSSFLKPFGLKRATSVCTFTRRCIRYQEQLHSTNILLLLEHCDKFSLNFPIAYSEYWINSVVSLNVFFFLWLFLAAFHYRNLKQNVYTLIFLPYLNTPQSQSRVVLTGCWQMNHVEKSRKSLLIVDFSRFVRREIGSGNWIKYSMTWQECHIRGCDWTIWKQVNWKRFSVFQHIRWGASHVLFSKLKAHTRGKLDSIGVDCEWLKWDAKCVGDAKKKQNLNNLRFL